MKNVLLILLYIIGVIVLAFCVFLSISTLGDYKPAPVELIAESDGDIVNVEDTIRILNWNVGYCGLGDDMSFFYDGGDRVRTTKSRVEENLSKITGFLSSHKDSIDFYLLQEVDVKSKRSHKINQQDHFNSVFTNYQSNLALNYKVSFVPIPLHEPLGKVKSGILTYGLKKSTNVSRYAFEGNYGWPKGLFMLDRCFMVNRFNTSNGKELLVVNTHNSAYDDGSLRKRQMDMIKTFLMEEYNKGNYIIVGGDWNQEPPLAQSVASNGKRGHLINVQIDVDFMPTDWEWVHNYNAPTNRMLTTPYEPGVSKTSVIDFFLVSPNVDVLYSKNIQLNFKNSDHNPVYISCSLQN